VTAFIIRPFGTKRNIDFEKVDQLLISAALSRLGIVGRTTIEIAAAGNIRADMFQLLLTADVVVADISIHNANVFYELGIRHALRDRATILLRADVDEVPFDLRTDRYLAYDPADPGRSLDELIEALSQTRQANRPDSPVFAMLPVLKPVDPSVLLVVPPDFREEVRRAQAGKYAGDLRLLSEELEDFRWKRAGLRVIGRALSELGDFPAAIRCWEAVRGELPDDVEANQRLGTAYQKSNVSESLLKSDEALARVLGSPNLSLEQLAETHALLGSNHKTSWISDWVKEPLTSRTIVALQSPHLRNALAAYREGFDADPRHFYSGINAVALTTVLVALAERHPDAWEEMFDSQDSAERDLAQRKRQLEQLVAVVEFSLNSARSELARRGTKDLWFDLTVADFALVTGKKNATALYRDALATAKTFHRDSCRRQLQIYRDLGMNWTSLEKSLELVGEPVQKPAPPRTLLFSGHRIDDPGRKEPRFPARCEPIAREAIRKALADEKSKYGNVRAIAGGASGGDLLFHEACDELGIEHRMYLIVPRPDFVKASVAPSGPDWVARFETQFAKASPREYLSSAEMPLWLQSRKDYNVWQRGNLWMFHNASVPDGAMTLIALWNGQPGDGKGGTEHMVKLAEKGGGRAVILDTKELFQL
jgi:tetratricopeptide (TPR) repeat protein